MAANSYNSAMPKEIEDAFINISFEDTRKSTSTKDKAYEGWLENTSTPRVSTTEYSHALFKKVYPKHSLVISQDVNPLSPPMVDAEPIYPDQMITSHWFIPLPRKEATPGIVFESVRFGAFAVKYEQYDFIVYVATYPFTPNSYGESVNYYILHEGPQGPSEELLLTAGIWGNQLHDEILVFNQGWWSKSRSLWAEVQKADWKDVILDADRKSDIRSDIYGFFKSEEVYKKLSIPWKRGIIMHGPPGNGKTISIKAIMKECFDRGFAPLYVKSFQSWMGEEFSMEQCFARARQESPCVLILEDLDSLINPSNRSFFLNQLDGIESNDGILCIGTTNHLELLDPALANRPSRFDKKYYFNDPIHSERVLYVRYWQKKLKDNEAIHFPDSLVTDVADLTDKFSFAYLKEAFVSTLFMLATQDEGDEVEFEPLLKKNIKNLRKAIDEGAPQELLSQSRKDVEAEQKRPLIMPSQQELQKELAKMKEQSEARDIHSRAMAAVRLGRRFIF